MVIDKVAEKEIRKNERKRLMYFAKSWRKDNERILKDYFTLIKDRSEEEVFAIISEKYNCTPRRVRNVISRKVGFNSPKMISISESLIINRMNKLINDAEDARYHADQILDEIEEAKKEGREWVAIEMTKGKDTIVKNIPIAEAKKRWLESKIKYSQEFFNSVKSLVPQTILNQSFNSTKEIEQFNDDELDEILENSKPKQFPKEKVSDAGI